MCNDDDWLTRMLACRSVWFLCGSFELRTTMWAFGNVLTDLSGFRFVQLAFSEGGGVLSNLGTADRSKLKFTFGCGCLLRVV
jgi:hypothetical protein